MRKRNPHPDPKLVYFFPTSDILKRNHLLSFHPLILVWGTAGFLIFFGIHLLIWRQLHPPREMAWLIVIFILLPTVATALLILLGVLCLWWGVLALIWQAVLGGAYIMTYPPIQAGCPSLRIVLAIHRAPNGLTPEALAALFPRESMFLDRFDDLIEDGLISWEYDTWGISGAGRLVARFFLAYRRLLRLPLGDG